MPKPAKKTLKPRKKHETIYAMPRSWSRNQSFVSLRYAIPQKNTIAKTGAANRFTDPKQLLAFFQKKGFSATAFPGPRSPKNPEQRSSMEIRIKDIGYEQLAELLAEFKAQRTAKIKH